MKSVVQLIAGLGLLVAVVRSMMSGYIPNRGDTGGTYASVSPSEFWLQIVVFGAMGIALLYLTWRDGSE